MRETEKILQQCRGDAAPACMTACPAHVNVKGYASLIAQSRFKEALDLIRTTMPFPGVCGRVCTHPCESECERNRLDQPVAIRALKRFVADYELNNGREKAEPIEVSKPHKAAVIGSGPAGLACAYDLVRQGYPVTVFEAMPESGGLLRYGIPEYRLPNAVLDNEIEYINELGVEIVTNTLIDNLDDLFKQGYKAVFVGAGAQNSRDIGVPGEKMSGVIHALDFLTQINSGQDCVLDSSVAVIGGGNAAIDAARSAWRLGARDVNIVYRRTRSEMPADPFEIDEAEREGVNLQFLAAPHRILSDNGKASAMECLRMELGEPDDSGRRRPEPVSGSEFSLDADLIIMAIGQSVDPKTLPPVLSYNRRETLKVDPVTLQTNIIGVFAGGDVVDGPSSVIQAVAAGKEAAVSIDRYLKGEDLYEGRPVAMRPLKDVSRNNVVAQSRAEISHLQLDKRKGFDEVEHALDEKSAVEEAQRCLACECKLCMQDCEFLNQVCEHPKEFVVNAVSGFYHKKPQIPYSCNLCDLCERICPEELNIGRACLEARQDLVTAGVAPLRPHKLLQKEQEWTVSDDFTLAIPSPAKGIGGSVFFPGCHLSSYSPSRVIETFDWLRQNTPSTGFLLRCCGAPTVNIGDDREFEGIISDFEDQVKQMGASEVIAACPNCYRTLNRYSKGIEIKSLYQVMADNWSPDEKRNNDVKLSIHDPCTGRWDTHVQDCIRNLAEWNGAQIHEMEFSRQDTHCCGMGGMIAYANPGLAGKITKKRIDETPFDLLTYCATCRESLAVHKPTLHILDLLFNPNWQEDWAKPPNKPQVKKENQIILKRSLQKKYMDQL